MDATFSELVKVIGAAGIGTILFAVFVRFSLRKFSEEGATAAIIDQLRKEVDRLADINEKLSHRVIDLQQQVINLRRENAELTDRISRLSAQIAEMRGQQA